MRPVNVVLRLRSRLTARFVGSCTAVVLLCVGMLSAAQPGSDLPPGDDTQQPSPGSPPPRFFGLTHLTPNHVAHLHFANPKLPGAGPNRPTTVRLEFVDSLGHVLLRSRPQVVMPGDMTSLDLAAEDLEFPHDSNEVGVRGLVTFFNPQARGISSLQVEDTAANSSFVLFDRSLTPTLVKKLDPLCTHPIKLPAGSLMRINLTNAGDRGFPAAQLSADLVIYSMRPHQQELARQSVLLAPMQSDSLVLEDVEGELFGTVEFKDGASRAISAGTYEFREGANGSVKVYGLNSCGGPYDSSSTSGGGATNSGGAG